MVTFGALQSQNQGLQHDFGVRLRERILHEPPGGLLDESSFCSAISSSTDSESVNEKPEQIALSATKEWRRIRRLCNKPWLIQSLLIGLAIHQIASSKNRVRNGTAEFAQPLASSRRALDGSKETPSSHYSRKPHAVVLDRNDGSVVPIDLSWFRIGENATETGMMTTKTRKSQNSCVPMHDWQEIFYTTCNNIHEMDLISASGMSSAKIVNNGHFRDVWEFREDILGNRTSWALKTLRLEYDNTKYYLRQQMTDAIISERLTSSPNVASIFGYCGYTGLYDYSHNGTLTDHYKQLGHDERLRIAAFISRGLADVHTLGGGKHASVVHTDIDARQFIQLNGNFVLNDFNNAGLLFWDEKHQSPCTWPLYKPKDKNRAPEEHFYVKNYINEKIDVYSLGNIFYKFLTNKHKYEDIRTKEAEKLIVAGDIPRLSDKVEKSKDLVHVALKHAMKRCLTLDAKERAPAKEIADYLEKAWHKLEKERNATKKDSKRQTR